MTFNPNVGLMERARANHRLVQDQARIELARCDQLIKSLRGHGSATEVRGTVDTPPSIVPRCIAQEAELR